MFTCNLFFDDPVFLEKVSTIVDRAGHHVKSRKFLVVEQFKKEQSEKQNHLLITNYNSLEHITSEELSSGGYSKILIIDTEEEELSYYDIALDVNFISIEKFLIPLISFLNETVEKFYDSMEFIPIQIKKLKENYAYPADFYLRLSEGKFVRLYSDNTHLDGEEIKKINSKYECFFIKADVLEDYTSFINSSDFVNPNATEDVEQNQVKSFETITDIVKEVGFPESAINRCNQLLESIEEGFKKDKFVNALVNRFKKMEGHVFHKHCYLTGVVAMSVASKFSWMSSTIQQNIFLGCMLHDIGMKNIDNAMNQHLPLSEIKKLSKEDQEDILGHPTRLLKVLVENPRIHQDVINIIKNHHAVHGQGESYPHNMSPSDISLPFAIFVLSHEVSVKLHQIDSDMTKVQEVYDHVYSKFSTVSYRKVLPEFMEGLDEAFES